MKSQLARNQANPQLANMFANYTFRSKRLIPIKVLLLGRGGGLSEK